MLEENSAIAMSIAKGIDFLYEHQLKSGEFVKYYSPCEDLASNCNSFSSPFTAAFICQNLFFLPQNDKVDKIIKKATDFLYQQLYYGVCNYCANYNYQYHIQPFDADSTSAMATTLLHVLGGYSGDSVTNKILLANRNKKGLIYTWIVPRLSSTYSKRFLRVALHAFLHPVGHAILWKKTSCEYADVDMGVNANVLYYLGDIPETQNIINTIIDTIRNNREANCDKWYYDPFVIYYLFSRNYFKGITALEPIKKPIIDRITAAADENGCIGNSIFSTAMSACALLNLDQRLPVLDKAIQYIISAQNNIGNWDAWGHYGAGNMNLYFGSEEVTTAFCLEALGRYRELLQQKHHNKYKY